MSAKAKYESLDRSKLDKGVLKLLDVMKKKTDNFENKEVVKASKVEGALDKLIAKYPDAVKKSKPKAKAKPKAKSKAKAKSTGSPKKETVMTVAKRIRKDGEKWQDALKRAKAEMGKETKKSKSAVESEMDKLKKLIAEDSVLKGFQKSDLQRDSVRKAKPRGKRKSTTKGETTNQYGTFKNKVGRPYWESRENRSDRYAPKYPANKPFLEDGGVVVGGSTVLRNNADIMDLGIANSDAVFKHGGAIHEMRKEKDIDIYEEQMKHGGKMHGSDCGCKTCMEKGGMMQGYNDRLDESLGMRDGVEPMMMQSYKDRRDESKGMEKAMGRRAYKSVGTMDKMAKGGRILVGRFDEKQLKNKEDKKAIEKAQKESGLTYIDSKIIKKGGKMFMEVHLIPNEEYYKSSKFAEGGMMQGYNDRLDESLGMRDGVEPMMMQSYKDRRDESKGMEKAMGRRAYQSVGTMDKMAKGGETIDERIKFLEFILKSDRFGRSPYDILSIENELVTLKSKKEMGLGGYVLAGGTGAYLGAKYPDKVKKVTDPLDKAVEDINRNLRERYEDGGIYEDGGVIVGGSTVLRDNGDIMPLGTANADAVFQTGGVTAQTVVNPNEAMADLTSTYGFDDVYAKGGKIGVGSVVANKKYKTIGIVRDYYEKNGDARTDADGMVKISDLEAYNPKKHKNYKIAPSTKDEIESAEMEYAKGGEIEDEMQYGSWYVEIQEDENDEEIRNQEVARLIREGYTSGFEPTWSLEITDIEGDIDEATENEIARLVEEGYTSGEVVMYKYAKGGVAQGYAKFKVLYIPYSGKTEVKMFDFYSDAYRYYNDLVDDEKGGGTTTIILQGYSDEYDEFEDIFYFDPMEMSEEDEDFAKGGEIDGFTMSMVKSSGDVTKVETEDAKIKMAKGGMLDSKISELKKGDEITIKFASSISKNNTVKLKVRSRNKIRKGTIDKITFNNVKNPKGVKYYAYERGNGKWGFAKGDLAISNIELVNINYMAKGGKVDFSKRTSDDFKLGELVYDTNNKRYGTIIGIYNKYNSDAFEVRLDSDGMQYTSGLRKLGEKGDNGTKKQLFEAVSSYERLRKDYPKNKYPKMINNPFYAKGGKVDDLGNPTDPKVISQMEKFIKEKMPKLDKDRFFTDGMKRKEAKRMFYEKYGYGAYDPRFSIFEKGGKIGFEGLSKKVAKRYVGKKVPKKFQNQYGKTYSPAEAKEVGDKVAGAVYRMQQAKKMAKGGMITSAPEYQKVRNAEYDRRVKSGKIKDTDDNFERFDEMYFDELVEKGRIDPNNYFAKGGEVKYAIYEDYYGNDIKTEKFDKGIDENEIVAPSGYEIADFDEDDDGVVYVRFQQEDEFAKGGEVADINKFKKQLIAKAKRKGLYENFGQAEVRKLEDKYGYSNNVREFDNWAMNFDLSQMAKGGKTQGYNDKLDESLGNTKGKRSTKEQNYKDRRNESEAMEKKGGKRKYARVKTMDKGSRKKKPNSFFAVVKRKQKKGEAWQDAIQRVKKEMKMNK